MAACPFCAEELAPGAGKCVHCGEALGRPEPPPRPKSHLALALGVSVLVGGALCVLAAIVIPRPRRGNEAAAIGSLKAITAAQTLFREGDMDDDGAPDYATLQELSDTRLVDMVLGAGQKQGYLFQVAPAPATPELMWMAVASPSAPGTTGWRYFVTNQDGVIYDSTTTPFALTPDCAIPAHATRVGK